MRREVPTPRHPAAPRSPPSRSPHPSGPPIHRVHLPRAHSSTTPTRGKSSNKRVDRSSDSRITPRAAPTAGTSRAAPAWCGLTYPPGTPASATSSPTSTSSHPTTSHPTRTNKESGKFIFISVWAIRRLTSCFVHRGGSNANSQNSSTRLRVAVADAKSGEPVWYEAAVVGTQRSSDLAVLRVQLADGEGKDGGLVPVKVS